MASALTGGKDDTGLFSVTPASPLTAMTVQFDGTMGEVKCMYMMEDY